MTKLFSPAVGPNGPIKYRNDKCKEKTSHCFFASAKRILLIPSVISRFAWLKDSSASFFGVPLMASLMAVSIAGSAARTAALMLE
jgi:hypothetical protein